MPRAKTTGKTDLYHKLVEARADCNEANDCAVMAVAAVADLSYDEARALLARFGRKDRDGTYFSSTTRPALESLGFRVVVRRPRDFIEQYPGVHAAALKGVTSHHPERFNAVWRDGRRYLFQSASHILAVLDGEVHDHSRGRALRVRAIHEVVRDGK